MFLKPAAISSASSSSTGFFSKFKVKEVFSLIIACVNKLNSSELEMLISIFSYSLYNPVKQDCVETWTFYEITFSIKSLSPFFHYSIMTSCWANEGLLL